MTMLDEVTQDYNSLKAKINKMQQELSAPVRAELVKAFKSAFDACSSLEVIQWVQYTPYFNDGEECTFSVHELEFGFDAPDGIDIEAMVDDLMGGKDCWNTYNECYVPSLDKDITVGGLSFWKSQPTTELGNQFKELNIAFKSLNSDLLRLIFDDHAVIRLYRGADDFDVDQYDHE